MNKNDEKRSKVLVKVNELTEVDVNTISLVEHAANRSPFKITKSAEGKNVSIDFSTLFTKVRKEQKTPAIAVASVIVQKGVEPAATVKFEELGLLVLSKEESDEGTVFNLIDDAEDVSIIKLDDNVAVGVTGIKKYFADWSEGTDFSENLQTSSFYPSLRMATDTLHGTIYNAMETVAKGESPKDTVKTILKEFSSYVGALVAAVPVQAFKFEGLKATKAPEVTKTQKTETTEKDKSSTKIVKSDATITEDTSTNELNFTEMFGNLRAELSTAITAAVEDLKTNLTKSNEVTATKLGERLDTLETDIGSIVSPTDTEDVTKREEQPKEALFNSALKFPGYDD